VPLADVGERGRDPVGSRAGPLEHDAFTCELVDVVGLRDAAPHVDVLVEKGAHSCRWVQGEIPPDLTGRVAKPLTAHEERRVDRPGREDRGVAPHPKPGAARRLGLDAPHAIALEEETACARSRVSDGAGVPRLRYVGDTDVLLRGCGTAEVAHARPDAPAHVAIHVLARVAEAVGAALDDLRVLPGDRGRRLGHVQLPLHSPQIRLHLLRCQLLEPEALGPQLQDGRRGAKAGSGVDVTGAPDGPAEREQDGRHAHGRDLTAVAVEQRRHVARDRGVIVRYVVLPFLEHHDFDARLRQLLRDRGATGAGPYDADVGVDDRVGAQLGAVDDAHLPRNVCAGEVTVRAVASRAHRHAVVALCGRHGPASRLARSSRPRCTFHLAS
jgi:hypothetical protein